MSNDNPSFDISLKINSLNSKDIGTIAKNDLMGMTTPEFDTLVDGRLMNVVRRKRRDMVVFDYTQGIATLGTAHRAFQKGEGEYDTPFNNKTDAARFLKNGRHTNMQTNGSFRQGDITIIRAIEIPIIFGACPPSAPGNVVKGVIVDPTVNTSKTGYDSAMHAKEFGKCFSVAYVENGKQKFIESMDSFPALDGGVVGYAGATPGGVSQNGGFQPKNIMNKVRVLVGDAEFYLGINAVNPFSLTNYGADYGLEIYLSTIEALNNTP